MGDNISIAFVCCVFDKTIAEYVINNDRNFPQFAANKLGWLFIDGLEYYYKRQLTIFSVINVSSYPGFSDLLIYNKRTFTPSGSELFYIPYINIKYIKQVVITISAFLMLIKWALNNKIKNKVIIFYSMYAPFPIVSRLVSSVFRVKTILIVLDLPEHMRIGMRTPLFMKLVLKINRWQLYLCSKYFDGYVFLTKYMNERFNAKNNRFTIIEGCVDTLHNKIGPIPECSRIGNERILIYAGQLNEQYGVRVLLSAFMSIKNTNFRLWICGNGPMRDEVLEYCDKDNRIKYCGVLYTDDLNKLYNKATALINPRTSDGVFTKYSFPSKILDYLKSGKPTIICKLDGIPDEYYKYTYVIEKENMEGFAKIIDEVLSKSDEELTAFGNKSKEWVLEYKNNVIQIRKVVNIINVILDGQKITTIDLDINCV